MKKINFQNLPSTETPINDTNLNLLQDNIEDVFDGTTPMGSIVVDSVESKNLLNTDNPEISTSGITWTGSGATHNLTTTIAFGGGVHWFIPVKEGEKYTFSYKQRNNTNVYLYIAERSQPKWDNTNVLRNIVNDGTNTSYSFTIQNDGWLSMSFQSSVSVSNVLIEEIQLEKGEIQTQFSEYQGLGYESGNNASGNYIKYNDGTLIQWGKINKEPFLQPNDIYTTVQSIKWYRSDPPSVQFPISFINTAYTLNITINTGTDGVRFAIPRISSKLSSYFQLQLISVEPFTSSGTGYTNLIDVEWIAIGNWK